jgi:serine acetyltransferase
MIDRRWRTFRPDELEFITPYFYADQLAELANIAEVERIGLAPAEWARRGWITFVTSPKWIDRLAPDAPMLVLCDGSHKELLERLGHVAVAVPDPVGAFWDLHQMVFALHGGAPVGTDGMVWMHDREPPLRWTRTDGVDIILPFKTHGDRVIPPLGGVHVGEDIRAVGRSAIAMGIYGEDTEIYGHVRIDNGVHVGHSAIVRERATLCANATIGGWCDIGEQAFIGIGATILPGRRVGARSLIGAGAVVTRDVPPDTVWAGNPARANFRSTPQASQSRVRRSSAPGMKLGVHVPAWGRLPLVRVVFDQITAVRAELADDADPVDLVVAVAGSAEDEPELAELCGQMGFGYTRSPNQPLGHKINEACATLQGTGCAGAVGIGSDDFVSASVFRHWAALLREGVDYMGMIDCYLLDLSAGRLVYWPGYTNHRRGETIGLGRCLSAKLLDELYWRPFDGPCKINLDASMTRKLENRRFTSRSGSLRGMSGRAMMVDIKSRLGNLNRMPDCSETVADARTALGLHFRPDILERLWSLA